MKIIRIIIPMSGILLGFSMLSNKNLIIKYLAIPYIIIAMVIFYIVDSVYLYMKKKKDE